MCIRDRDYTFHLKDGATFSNGEPITAEDVKFSIEFIRDDCSQWAWVHEDLDSAEVVDDKTCVLHYKTADASRLALMCDVQSVSYTHLDVYKRQLQMR